MFSTTRHTSYVTRSPITPLAANRRRSVEARPAVPSLGFFGSFTLFLRMFDVMFPATIVAVLPLLAKYRSVLNRPVPVTARTSS